ncbi:hypothetical protein JCM11491_006354 [Sporobolomyces phaffii]
MLEEISFHDWPVETLARAAPPPFASSQVRAISAVNTLPSRTFEISQLLAPEMWSNVVYIFLAYHSDLEIGLLALLPSLVTLICMDTNLRLERPDYTFLALKRLNFLGSTVSGSLEDVQAVFSATTMPSVRHLALDLSPDSDRGPRDYEQTFRNLFPQITSLTLTEPHLHGPTYRHLTLCLPLMSRLSHMLHAIDLHDLPEFLAAIPTPVKLGSLHLSCPETTLPREGDRYSDEIIAIACENEGAKLQTGKVYLYLGIKSPREFADLAPYVHFVEGYPSRQDFDGSPPPSSRIFS